MNKTLGAVLVVVIVIATIGAYMFPKVQQPLGALSSPDIQSSYLSVNGVSRWYESRSLNQASTTICAMKSPTATSTLVSGSVKLTTGTTTAIALELAKSTSFAATTTRISYAVLGAGEQVTLTAFVASTTAAVNSGRFYTANETDLVFAPNTFLTAKYGGAAGSLNVLVGSCKAVWMEN